MRKSVHQKSNGKNNVRDHIRDTVNDPIFAKFLVGKFTCQDKQKKCGRHIDQNSKDDPEIGRGIEEIGLGFAYLPKKENHTVDNYYYRLK